MAAVPCTLRLPPHRHCTVAAAAAAPPPHPQPLMLVQLIHLLSVPRTFQCPVCMEEYDEATKIVPRILPCGHTACQQCLQKMLTPLQVNSTARPRARLVPIRLSFHSLACQVADLHVPRGQATGKVKHVECPVCREKCAVDGGQAKTLTKVYDLLPA